MCAFIVECADKRWKSKASSDVYLLAMGGGSVGKPIEGNGRESFKICGITNATDGCEDDQIITASSLMFCPLPSGRFKAGSKQERTKNWPNS
uniref:Uncharacterized protein n=1 Tax=Ditylenchus dipsaci TaxID=166011 RepID=A0A915DF70_9BILA